VGVVKNDTLHALCAFSRFFRNILRMRQIANKMPHSVLYFS
jgi:hypothetical protein